MKLLSLQRIDIAYMYNDVINIVIFHSSGVFPPRILYFHNKKIYDQEAVDLFCNISAHPSPTVEWYKGDSSLEGEIEELDRWVSCGRLLGAFYRVKSDVRRLRICNPQNAPHTGYYTCIAANRRGKSNATAFLDVLGKIAFKLLFYSVCP